MKNIFIPNHFSLLGLGSEDVEILEITSPNGSGECFHTFILHISSKISMDYEKSFLSEIQTRIKNSQIAIRECKGGINVVTSLRFLNGKLGEIFHLSHNINEHPHKIYFTFFLKSLLYMVNYYYFILGEKDIRIQKDGFQTLYSKNAETYSNFISTFASMENALETIGFFKFLFEYEIHSDQYVLQESVFLSLTSKQIMLNKDHEHLQVYCFYYLLHIIYYYILFIILLFITYYLLFYFAILFYII